MVKPIKIFADLAISVNDVDMSVKADGETMTISLPTLKSVRKTTGFMFDLIQHVLTFLRGQGMEVHIFAGTKRIATLGPKQQRAA
jgi:hypothetical protein